MGTPDEFTTATKKAPRDELGAGGADFNEGK